MTAVISDQRNLYYDRNYGNDFKPTSLAQRVALVALPFLALHRSLRYPIHLGTSSLRFWSQSRELFTYPKNDWVQTFKGIQASIAIIALAAAIFAHPMGLIVTTAQDAVLEMHQLVTHLKTNQYLEASKSLAKLTNHALYLALLCKGGLELAIVSLIFNALVLILASHEAFKQGNRLKGCAHFAIAAIRFGQCYTQIGQGS